MPVPSITSEKYKPFVEWLKTSNKHPGIYGSFDYMPDNQLEQLMKDYGSEYQVSQISPTIKNRFDNYEDPFSYEDQKAFMDQIFGGYEDQINKQAAEDTADLQHVTASRMASRGITGGSIVDDTMSGIGTDVAKSKYNALSNLKTGKAKGLLGLMDTANKSKFATTGMASNVDFQNFANELQKLGLLSDINFKQQYLDLQKENQPGWLEDLFSGISDIASLIPGLGDLGLLDFLKPKASGGG